MLGVSPCVLHRNYVQLSALSECRLCFLLTFGNRVLAVGDRGSAFDGAPPRLSERNCRIGAQAHFAFLGFSDPHESPRFPDSQTDGQIETTTVAMSARLCRCSYRNVGELVEASHHFQFLLLSLL